MRRAALVAALATLLLAVGPVSAADPELIGGSLTAGGRTATLTSTATMPVAVTVTASDVRVEPASFTLDPGKAATMTLTGPAKGTVTAELTSLSPAEGADNASVVLQVKLSPVAPSSPPWGMILFGVALAAGAVLAIRRVRPWELRLTRGGPPMA